MGRSRFRRPPTILRTSDSSCRCPLKNALSRSPRTHAALWYRLATEQGDAVAPHWRLTSLLARGLFVIHWEDQPHCRGQATQQEGEGPHADVHQLPRKLRAEHDGIRVRGAHVGSKPSAIRTYV